MFFPGGHTPNIAPMTPPGQPSSTGIEIVAQLKQACITKMSLMSGGEVVLSRRLCFFCRLQDTKPYVFDDQA